MLSIGVSGNTIAELRDGLVSALQVLGCQTITSDAPAATLEKRKPGRPAAAKPEATEAPAPAPAEAVQVEPVETADDMAAALGLEDTPAPAPAKSTEPVYTMDQVKAALQELSKPRTGDADSKAGMQRVIAVMTKLGVKMVKDIPAEKFAETIRRAQAS